MMAFHWFKLAERDFRFKSRDHWQPLDQQFVAQMGDGFASKFIRKPFNSNLSLLMHCRSDVCGFHTVGISRSDNMHPQVLCEVKYKTF